MEHGFWAERWNAGRTGFHQPDGHPWLAPSLADLPSGRVLVPLAGKTVDVVTLHAHGYDVVAVEFVDAALREFAREQSELELRAVDGPLGLELRADRLRFVAADMFAVDPSEVGTFDLIYDRAALVALPPTTRARYVQHLRRFLAPQGEVFALTFEYDEQYLEGPPFSVPADEVLHLYDGAHVESVDERTLSPPDHLAAGGLTSMTERSFRVRGAATPD